MNKLKKSSFLIVTFVTISFFSLIMVYFMQKSINLQMNKEDFLSDETISFSCEIDDCTDINTSLLNVIGDYTLLKDNDGMMNYKGLFFKGKLIKFPHMMEGRFFSEQDFRENERYIVIGKNLSENVITQDGQKLYYLENNYYKVIGIMGNDNEDTAYDNLAYVNLDSLLNKDSHYINGKYKIDAKTNTKNLYELLKKQYSDTSIHIRDLTNQDDSTKRFINISAENTFKYIIEVVCILIINTILIAEYWIKNRKKEIGIKRIVGATKLHISINILSELILISLLCYAVGYIIFLIISYIIDGYFHFYIFTAISVLIITIVSGLIASIVPIINANKMEPSEVIK